MGKKATRPNPLPALCLPSEFKAAIFDLDGVVVDSEAAHLLTFNQTVIPLGARISDSRWKRNYTGVGSIAIMEDLFSRHRLRGDVMLYVKRRATAYQRHVDAHGLPQIKGFKSFHSLLQRSNVKIYVASGGHRPHIKASLRAVGLPRQRFVGLEDVKRQKPAPDLFLLSAKRLRVKPSECIVFEDSLAGIEAARRAGMPCIALATTLPRKEIASRAALVARDFESRRLRKAVLSRILGANAKASAGKSPIPQSRKIRKNRKGASPLSPRLSSRSCR